MKKIIIAFDGAHFSEGAFEFARRLNEISPLLLTGVFLPQAELANLWSYAPSTVGAYFVPVIEDDEPRIIEENIQRFEKLCQGNNIDYRIHKDFYDLVLPELKKESMYADLMIIGAQVFYETMGINSPEDFLKDILVGVSCPVLLVPEKFDFPKSVVLAYDGSEGSVFAIKQFAYLFPELADSNVLLVYASDKKEKDFPQKIQIEELTARHFKNLTLSKLDINPKKHFVSWLQEKKSAMLVSGSYGRSGLSQLFKKSFITEVIKEHRLPVFIAHK
jgi:nucleotide-binding universal stress UspA family protein